MEFQRTSVLEKTGKGKAKEMKKTLGNEFKPRQQRGHGKALTPNPRTEFRNIIEPYATLRCWLGCS